MDNSKGIVFFNFGKECGMRMLVTMYTLRKYYKENAILLLAKEDKDINDRLAKEAKILGIDIDYYDLNRICKRNLKSVMAPKILKISPYTASIQVDADTSFRHSPQEILDGCFDKGILVTHFCNWWSNGPRMKKRIDTLKHLISEENYNESINHKAAVNCGVVGYCKGKADTFQEEWEGLTDKGAGIFIMEEIACQVTYWKYPHHLAPLEWNVSVLYGDLESSKIIHYHGHKHTNLERKISRYWWAELGWALEDNKISKESFQFWTEYDNNVKDVICENGFDHIEKAKEEFSTK